MENNIQEKIIKALLDYENFIAEKQNIASEQRIHNQKAWEEVERKLTKKQGKHRSHSYQLYKAYSLSLNPLGSTLYNDIINNLTKYERQYIGC